MNDLIHRTVLGPDPLLFAASVTTAVALAAGLGLALARALRRRPAPLRYGLLLAALCVAVLSPALTAVARRAKLGVVAVTPPATTVAGTDLAPAPPPRSDESIPPPGDSARLAAAPVAVAAATSPPSPPWWRVAGSLLCAAWAAGTLVGFVRLGLGVVRLRRFMLTLRPCDDAVARRLLDRAAAMLGVRRPPRLCASSALPVPMVMGLFRPAVVLPAGLAAEMDVAKLEAVLLHEAAHVAHGDLWVGLFQRLAAALLWWCPLVHALNRGLSDLREEICDDYVLAAQGDGLALAEVLVGFAERARGTRWAAAVGAMGVVDERPGLAGRIERLLRDERDAMTKMNRTAVLGTIGFALLAGGAVLATTVRAEERAPQDKPAADKPDDRATAWDRLAAAGFWAAFARDPAGWAAPADAAEAHRIAADAAADPALRLRASAATCGAGGGVRALPEIPAADAARALAAAMGHLESNLADETVRRFAPDRGVTHVTVSRRADDAAHVWVLVESVDPARRGGLNVAVGAKTGAVAKVAHWGHVAAAPAAAPPAAQPAPAVPVAPAAPADRPQILLTVGTKIVDGGDAVTQRTDVAGRLGRQIELGAARYRTTLVVTETEPGEAAGSAYVVAATIVDATAQRVISAPKVVVRAGQEGTIAIDDGRRRIEVTVTVSPKPPADAAAHRPATGPAPGTRPGTPSTGVGR